MAHKIEAFVSNCPLCKEILDEIELGKCAGCELIVYDISKNIPKELIEKFGIRVVPTIIIDRKIKIEGKPDIPFICSDKTYEYFEKNYGMKKDNTRN